MTNFAGEITTIAEIYNLPHGTEFCTYRGHSNSEWNLIPSFFRALPKFKRDSVSHFEALEERFIAQFFDKCRPYINSSYDGTNFWDRVIAQHYGLPTRLLDVTSDPHVALFFAVTGGHDDVDGAVFSIVPTDGAHTFYNKNRSPNAQNPDAFLGSREVVLVEPPIIDQRVVSKKSKFLLSKNRLVDGNFLPLEERQGFEEKVKKWKVSRYAKKKIKRELNCIGVNVNALFPSMESVASLMRDEMLETA